MTTPTTMMASPFTTIFLGVYMAAGCSSSETTPGDSPQSDEVVAASKRFDDHGSWTTSTGLTPTSVAEVKDVPAVNRDRYPDSIGYLYEGSLATIFWLQNEPRVTQFDDLVRRIGRDMRRGLTGEVVSSRLQHVDPVPSIQPELPEMSKQTIQAVRRLAQYAFLTSDYGGALGAALHAYNTDPARLQVLTAQVARVETLLDAMATPNPARSLPSPPPPASQRMIRPGKYFAEAMQDHARAHLTRSVSLLEKAISTGAAAAYADAFNDVFLTQWDHELSKNALEALAMHHVDGILRGQPLDAVIARFVTPLPAPDRPLSVEQLSLINRINLISNDASVSRSALVAALLLVDEDHRQGEQDGVLSCTLIWQHVSDAPWLMAQLVRLKGGSATAAQLNELIDGIVASL